MAQIGIKLADGSFYPILDGDRAERKRLTLTVASPGQAHAQIDIIERGDDGDRPVGSLVLDDLGSTDGELELVIGLNGERQLDAQVTDHTGEQYQSLAADLDVLDDAASWSMGVDDDLGDIGSVDSLDDIGLPDLDSDDDLGSLDLQAALDESDEDFSMPSFDDDDADTDTDAGGDDDLTMPDFSMPDIPLPDSDEDEPSGGWDGGSDDEDDDAPGAGDGGSYVRDADGDFEDEDEYEEAEARPYQPLMLAAIILISLSLVALGAFGLFSWLSGEPLPPLRAAGAALRTILAAFV